MGDTSKERLLPEIDLDNLTEPTSGVSRSSRTQTDIGKKLQTLSGRHHHDNLTIDVTEPDSDDRSSVHKAKDVVVAGAKKVGEGAKKVGRKFNEGVHKVDEITDECWDYIMNPCFGCSVRLFFLAGVFGGIALFLYHAHNAFANMDVYVAGTLCFMGGLAAFELEWMGTVKEQILYLRKLVDQIGAHVEVVSQGIDGVHQENRKFGLNVSYFSHEKNEFRDGMANLRVQRDLLVRSREEAVKETEELNESVRNLQKESNQLQETKDALQERIGDLETQVAQFSELRREIDGIVNSEENLDFTDYLDSVNAAYEEINDLIEHSERINLHQKALSANRNGDDGLDKKEFARFKRNVGKKMKAIMEQKRWDWETLSNGAERIQQYRMEKLIEDMLEVSNPKPKQRKRSTVRKA